MQPTARDAYLQTQVLTASPQKLRLMLIDGAMRFVNQTAQAWDERQDEVALEALIRAREIIAELMASLSPDKSPLARQILPVYIFLFRSLTEAGMERDRAKLDAALRVLGEERTTWQQICEKFVDEVAPAPPEEILAPTIVADASPAAIATQSRTFDSSRVMGPAMLMHSPPSLSSAVPRGVSLEA